MVSVVGWDIGGAHLKAARAEGGRVVEVVQVAAPLRLGVPALESAFTQVKARMGVADRHVCTMTGELADTFASRTQGVDALTSTALAALSPQPVAIYGGRSGLVEPQAAMRYVEDIASANWYATATLVAKHCDSAVLVDMGSTTTDLVPIAGGAIVARGYTDAERLACGELVYTGLVRSFLMAIADRAPIGGYWTELVRENFATMADVHRLLGHLAEDADQMSTADGRPKTISASAARLARMVGRDADETEDWTTLARWFAEAQIRSITDSAMLVCSREALSDEAPLVVAGIGAGIIGEVARRLSRRVLKFESLLDVVPDAQVWASYCAPAAALAVLNSMEATS